MRREGMYEDEEEVERGMERPYLLLEYESNQINNLSMDDYGPRNFNNTIFNIRNAF